jgi:eukaryotic-like serine/threonine-protein kinase
MGEADSIPKFDPKEPEEEIGSQHSQKEVPSATAGTETTLDTEASAIAGIIVDRVSIGAYVLVRKLGEGGMGQVWLAEQSSPVRRRVALKLIKGGLYDSLVIQRFDSERQSLALMNHPAIAKIFDAGSTPDGQPYFVMEYVDGPSITRYCDNKKLKIRERLELFIDVCEAVQHAHQKAIIHRDLKPSNVLVEEVDGKPVPRIIDFGIAKAISSQAKGDQTLLTKMGALVGTPGFMSPEQADPSVLDVDTRTDVYSLGVILYVLLTGRLPFDPDEWSKRPIDEILRQLRQEDPPSPSAKLSGEKKAAGESAGKRSSDQKQLVSILRGDLDWITLKALERDRVRRYGAPAELAADVQRYLRHEPVTARPASTSYRMRKYIRRHRVGVGVAVASVIVLAAFAINQTVQIRRITRERDRVDRVSQFTTDMFKVSDPSEARGNSITVREVLDKSSKDIDKSLEKDPELRARMMYVMGLVYQNLGLYPKAQPLLEQAAKIQRATLGPDNVETLGTMNALVRGLEQEGRLPEAEKLARDNVVTARQSLGAKNANTLKSMHALGTVLIAEGNYAEAEKLAHETLDNGRNLLGPEHPDSIKYLTNLAAVEIGLGHYAESEKLVREALEVQRRVVGPEHPDTLLLMNNLAVVLEDEERPAEAEKMERELLDIQRRILGPEHPDTLRTMDNMANALSELGRYAEAEKQERDTIEIDRRVFGPNHTWTAGAIYNLACILVLEGRRDEAIPLLHEALEHGLELKTVMKIESDTDLKALHGDPRFDAVVAAAHKHVAEVERLKPPETPY